MGNKLPTLLLLTILLFLTHPLQASYQSGLDEYNAGNYKTARYEWIAVIASPPGKYSPSTIAETNYAIGMLYWLGQGVEASYSDAFNWLKVAADMGHAGAEAKLGYLYTQGITVPQNYESAFNWFSKAAKQGDIDGQYNLGIFYLNGWGTEQNKTMAAQYLAAASAQGDEAAEIALQDLLAKPRHPGEGRDLHAQNQPRHPENNRHPGEGRDLQPPTPHLINPPTWIHNQPPTHYTIQVIGLRSKQAIKNLIQGHKELAPYAIYTVQNKNKPLYILIQGVYPDVASARHARDQFPARIQAPDKVWIRQFKKIQALIEP